MKLSCIATTLLLSMARCTDAVDYYAIKNKGSGKCLIAKGSNLELAECDYSDLKEDMIFLDWEKNGGGATGQIASLKKTDFVIVVKNTEKWIKLGKGKDDAKKIKKQMVNWHGDMMVWGSKGYAIYEAENGSKTQMKADPLPVSYEDMRFQFEKIPVYMEAES